MIKQKSATVTLTIEEFTKDNLALALYGNYTAGATGTVTDEPLPAGLVVGDRYALAHPKVSALVVKDDASATLTLGTHYTADTDFGAIQILNLASFVPPFKASYSYGAVTEIGIFTQPLPERFLRLEGLNTAQGNAKTLVELYRIAFDPLKEISFISDEYNRFELEGSLLADPGKPVDAVLGQFGRLVQLA
jgi:hypothetical protein